MTNFFIIERKTKFLSESASFLRLLYTPITGIAATILYSVLNDLYEVMGARQDFDEISFLTSLTSLSPLEIKNSLRRLEAVGLIRTFESADGKKTIFSLIDPLRPDAFRRNSLLYKMLIGKIGEIGFEKIEFAFKQKTLSKDEYKEVTVRFQDIFNKELVAEPKQDSTLELPLVTPKSKEEAIKGLTAPQFVLFLTNAKVTPSQLAAIQRMQNRGMSNESINTMIDYVVDINGSFVTAHFEKIAKDMYKKDITSKGIGIELTNAKKSRQAAYGLTSVVEEQAKAEQNSPQSAETDKSWDEIFELLGGEL